MHWAATYWGSQVLTRTGLSLRTWLLQQSVAGSSLVAPPQSSLLSLNTSVMLCYRKAWSHVCIISKLPATGEHWPASGSVAMSSGSAQTGLWSLYVHPVRSEYAACAPQAQWRMS